MWPVPVVLFSSWTFFSIVSVSVRTVVRSSTRSAILRELRSVTSCENVLAAFVASSLDRENDPSALAANSTVGP